MEAARTAGVGRSATGAQCRAIREGAIPRWDVRAGLLILVSARSPLPIRPLIRLSTRLPVSRGSTIRAGSFLFSILERLVPHRAHMQLALMATLMGIIDLVLDEVALEGRNSVLRVASLLTAEARAANPLEVTLERLACSLRSEETDWQAGYWTTVLLPATREYCEEEALAASKAIDPSGMGYRRAGIETAIKGMWYVVGPFMGFDDDLDVFQRAHWNREQRWMADTRFSCR